MDLDIDSCRSICVISFYLFGLLLAGFCQLLSGNGKWKSRSDLWKSFERARESLSLRFTPKPYPFKGTLLRKTRFGNALHNKSWSTCEINPRCNWDVRAGDVTNQDAIKPAKTKLSLAFCVFTSALCEIVCPICWCLSLLYKENRYGEQATTSF